MKGVTVGVVTNLGEEVEVVRGDDTSVDMGGSCQY